MIGKSIRLSEDQTLTDVASLIQAKAPKWIVKPKGRFLNVEKDGKVFLLRELNSELKVNLTVPLWINIAAIVPAIIATNIFAPNAGFLIRFLITFVSILALLVLASTLYSNSNAAVINQFYDDLDKIINEEV